jgi:hypothetical protein
VMHRRVAALLVAALLLLGAGVAAAVTHEDDDDPSEQALTTSTTTVAETTTTPAPATTAAPATITTTAAGRPTTTSTTRRPTTTTSRPASTTTTAARPPTLPSAAPKCTPDHIGAAIAVDRPSYTAAQSVQVTSTLRNRSSTTCFYNGYTAGISFRNDAGASYGGVTVVADSFADVPLRPGETLTHTGTWDHRACPEPGCGPLPPGPYYAIARWTIAAHTYEVLISLILS